MFFFWKPAMNNPTILLHTYGMHCLRKQYNVVILIFYTYYNLLPYYKGKIIVR